MTIREIGARIAPALALLALSGCTSTVSGEAQVSAHEGKSGDLRVESPKLEWRPCRDIPQSAIHTEGLDAGQPKASQSVRTEREDYSCEYLSHDRRLLDVTVSTQDWVDWHSEVWGDQTVTPEIFNNRLAYTWLPKDPRGNSCALLVSIPGGTYRQKLVMPAEASAASDKCMTVNVGYLNAFDRYLPR